MIKGVKSNHEFQKRSYEKHMMGISPKNGIYGVNDAHSLET
jgi:hypothetical protein